MFLHFLSSLAVLKMYGFNFNVLAAEQYCQALSVKDTCAGKMADVKQPQKSLESLLWSFAMMRFEPQEDTKKVLVGPYSGEVPEEITKAKPEMDPLYLPIPANLGPFILTCADDRNVFPNACSGYEDIEIFTLKKARKGQASEKMVHERALGDPFVPNIPPGFANEDLMKKIREMMVKQYKDQGFPSEVLTFGAAWYFFSEYDAETKETKDVMKGVFPLGKGVGTCEKEYKVNGTACFGMQGTSRPAVDPPKPPALPDTVQPPIPELKAKKPPGGSAGVIIAVVVVILLLIGAGGFFYVRQKKIEAAHGREVEMS